MKKIVLLVLLAGYISTGKSQCPPNAFAFLSPYVSCPSGCGVLLNNWPEGVLVNIYGGTPIVIVTSVVVSGTLGGPGVGSAFTCVPCGVPLIFASTVVGATSGCVILNSGGIPVTLMNFSAKLKNEQCTLNWESANETINAQYYIERSIDGINFTSIHLITGSNSTTNINKYSFTDPNPLPEIGYYRILMREASGKESYSEILKVTNSNKVDLNIFPNPFENFFSVSLNARAIPAVIEIYDLQGKLLHRQLSQQTSFLITKQFAKGIYMLKVTTNDNQVILSKLIHQ
ncbi:MAG: T9SS type A sorting domain-containing protein [Ferruginibacter sp.]